MSRLVNNKLELLRITLSKQGNKCLICNKAFIDINEYNTDEIVAHHQGKKTIDISNACNKKISIAYDEFINGNCVWLHASCHRIMHKVTRTEKRFTPLYLKDISNEQMETIKKSIDGING